MTNDLRSSRLEEINQCREIELFCVKLFYEFLICNDFEETIAAFSKEIQNSQLSLPDELPKKKDRIEKDNVLKIISALEMEDHLQFFEKWTDLVPGPIRDLPDYKNITLPLYTYFATLPVRKEKTSHVEEVSVTKDNPDENTSDLKSENKENETNNLVNGFNQLKSQSLNSTFTLEKPTIENLIEVDYSTERDTEMEPDSLESEIEMSDAEGKRKPRKNIPSKANKKKEDDAAVVVYKEIVEEDRKDKESNMLTNEKRSSSNEIFINEEQEKKEKEEEVTEGMPTAMAMFQDFLLEKKYSFNTEPQYLPLFALPFIQNPEEHEAFNQLFQDKWVKDLKESLFQFLIKFNCGDNVIPDIVRICMEHKQYANSMKRKTEQNEDYSKLYKESRRKLHKLKRDHKNLVGVASELATALENSVRGEAVDINSTLTMCIKIFPELFPNAQISESTFQNGLMKERTEKDRTWVGVTHLDTKKIKDDLTNASIKTKLLLMQALRWGICEADVEERERIVSWLSREDIVGLAGEEGIGRTWLSSEEAHPLQQAIARLLNCTASLRTGRDYISAAQPPLVPVIATSLLRVSAQDRLTQDMLLALLQKLSLRRNLCDEMIQHGLLEWLSSKLGQSQSLYQLEYTTSLFMNLCIYAPISYWDTRPHQILPQLLKLLSTPFEQVLEFVLGSLYCLLRSDKLNIFARSVGLSSQLSAVTCERCQRQAAELLKLHRRELSPATVSLPNHTLNEEDIEDPEDMEAEVNVEDPVKGSPSGNKLLAQNYCLIFPSPGMVSHGSEDRMRLRPSTPRALQSLPAWAI